MKCEFKLILTGEGKTPEDCWKDVLKRLDRIDWEGYPWNPMVYKEVEEEK